MWLSGDEPPANAGDVGSIPDPRRSHAPQSNEARGHAAEPVLQNLGAARGEAATMTGPHTTVEGSPHAPQSEKSPHALVKTQHSQKERKAYSRCPRGESIAV